MSAESSKVPASTSEPGKRPQIGPLAAVVVTLLSVVLGQVLAGAAVWLTAAVAGIFAPALVPDTWLVSTMAQFLFVTYSAIFTLVAILLFIRRRHVRWTVFGFKRYPQWSDLAYAFIGGAAYMVMLIAAGNLAGVFLGVDVNQEQEIGFEQAAGAAALALVFVSLVLVAPFLEEFVFRGFLFTSLRKKLSLVWAALITSLLFAAPHTLASSTGPLWIAAIDTFILSLVLCYLRERTGNLWAPIALHALKNGAAFTFLFVVL